jgi:maltose alpha-D-glucosyltransferase/alpha-amylase
MQWSPDRNGGFSRADPAALALPSIMDPLYGYDVVNVESQTRDPHSLLNWMRRMLSIRGAHPAFGRGTLRFLYPKNRKVLAYLRCLEGETILCVANVARTPQAVEIDLSEFVGHVPVELSGGSLFPPIGQLTYLLTLPPYGFYWFVLAPAGDPPSWHTPAPEPLPDYATIVLRDGLEESLLESAALREVLPAYLAKRRWFAAKDQVLKSARLVTIARVPDGERHLLLSEIEAETDVGVSRWSLPLSILWEDEAQTALPTQLAVARVRKGRRVGLLTDAFALPDFALHMLSAMADGTRIKSSDGEIVFEATPGAESVLKRAPNADVMWLTAEQSNSSLIVDDAAMLKIFRRVTAGQHPETEMSRHLTEQGFANAPNMLGEVVRVGADGARHSLAVAQAFVRNQGDAWTWTLNQFNRVLEDLAAHEASEEDRADKAQDYDDLIATIGRQLSAMHSVLARPSDEEAFAPRRATAEDIDAWINRARTLLDHAFNAIANRPKGEDAALDAIAARLLDQRPALLDAAAALARQGKGSLLTRVHGDFHLGQVLVVSGDAYIIDFEGEPGLKLAQRRAKTSPLIDVAGLLRSLDYAVGSITDPKNLVAARLSSVARDAFIARLRAGAESAFLDAYREGVKDLPDLGGAGLLDFFLLQKAAYEIGYEAANRPSWLHIPLQGLSRLADRLVLEVAK